ncbi:MAG: radical SAM protein [Crenarchaeota archaeon]|nr:radical SAM protein [Thermoproteota archaeon]
MTTMSSPPKYGGPLPRISADEKLIRWTSSLCPHCFRVLPAAIVERSDGVLYIKRVCPEHGEIDEIYYGDAEMLRRFEKYDFVGRGPGYAYTEARAPCPLNCGLCPLHKSHTCLLNIVVTNRCDLSCWYCFFYAERAGFVYEPSIDDIRNMVRSLKKQPGIVPAIQLTGGEPTLREDLVDIVKVLREEGVRHVQLNTTGIRFASLYLESPSKAIEYARSLRSAGVNTVYMSFDGVTPQSNPKNHWEAPYILEVFKHGGMTSAVLVPTILKSVNDHELGSIIAFAAHNMDIVRGVNIQPVSLVGMMRKQERSKYRITIPEVIKKIEEQTDGQITRDDWYPVGTVVPFARFLEAIDPSKRVEFTAHPACGAATYIYVRKRGDEYEYIPITRFIRVDDMMDYLAKKARELESKPKAFAKLMAIPSFMNIINKFIVWSKVPEEIRSEFKNILVDILFKRSYDALGRLHYKMLFIGMMHFMDEWNYDVQRVMRCVIHYALPDGRIVPFCAFNILNHLYRDAIHKKYGMPLEEYIKRYGKSRIVKYVRTKDKIERLTQGEVYKRRYEAVLKTLKK